MHSFLYSFFFQLHNLYWKITYVTYRKRYKLDLSFRFNGAGIQLYGSGLISVGKNSYIGGLTTIQSGEGCLVAIGQGCAISHNVRIYTSSWDSDADLSVKPIPEKSGNVTIGDYCWIGANVFINPGISIGDNAVVGANSVVTHDVPPFEVWGGVPAKFIRRKSGK